MKALGRNIPWRLLLTSTLLLLLGVLEAKAQEIVIDSIPQTDSILQEVDKDQLLTPNIEAELSGQDDKKKETKPYDLIPKRAVLFSIIPGGGQIYNRQYWKLPIIIGAYTACYYAISWNNNNLVDYTNAFRDINSKTPLEYDTWKDFLPYGASPENYVNNPQFKDQLKRGRDFYRRNRDLSIIITAGVYLLVMVDAYVDAELYSFDISPNITLSAQPKVLPPSFATPHTGYGVSLALNF